MLREINDLNQRFDNFAEWTIWQALGGGITYNYGDVQSTVNYKFPTSPLRAARGVLADQQRADLGQGTRH